MAIEFLIFGRPQRLSKLNYRTIHLSDNVILSSVDSARRLILVSSLIKICHLRNIQFLSLLHHANLTQHVLFPTHRHSHTLDLVITSVNFTLPPTVTSLPVSSTDHFSYHMFIEDY